MNYYNQFTEYQAASDAIVSFGKYDGFHRGHQLLIDHIQELQYKEGLTSAVCVFDMPTMGKLMTSDERRSFLNDKVDILIDCPFDDALRTLEAEAFITDIISKTLKARFVVVGTDFRFGYQKMGNVHLLRKFENRCHYKTIVVDKMKCRGTIISSTKIKSFIQDGNMDAAADFLGYHYSMTGIVERGNRLGRRLGFPTINVSWPAEKLCPPFGVYFCSVKMDGQRYHAICNIGVKPTVSDEKIVLAECFLLSYDGEAYGRTVQIELLTFHRPEKRFSGIDELKKQVYRDICDVEKFFGIN